MMQCNPTALPYVPQWDISPAVEGEERLGEIETQRLQSNIGSLRFITDTVVYEIAFIVSALARAMLSPAPRH